MFALPAAIFLPSAAPALDNATTGEYRVKGAFLLNFLKFTEWPNAPGAEPLVIGVLLPDPFGSELDEAARSAKVSGRRVEVRRFRKLGDARGCHILFIPRDAEYAAAELPKPGRLTVGETPQFLASGGIISFYLEESRVRFEIDPDAALQAGLRINAHVLQLGPRR
jgi:preprotein translocase subunit Sec61beta